MLGAAWAILAAFSPSLARPGLWGAADIEIGKIVKPGTVEMTNRSLDTFAFETVLRKIDELVF